MWRRWLALSILVLWVAISIARLTLIVAPPEQPPGPELTPAVLAFVRTTLPAEAGYLYVLPGDFGADTGSGPRLRYELFPRRYDDLRAADAESVARDVMRREGLHYVVVPDATQYPSGHWLRTPRDWLRRIELDATRYVLEVVTP
jgi:hypothetical protein